MKNIAKNKTFHYMLVVAAVAFGAYTFLVYAPAGQAVSSMEIGSLEAMVIPSPVSIGTESVSLSFSSNSGAGNFSLSGWTISNGDNTVYEFAGGTELADSESIKVCADMSVEKCDAEWPGGESWPAVGTFILKDETGQTVISTSYTTEEGTGDDVTIIHTINTPVYSHNDKIIICHEDNKGELGSKGVPTGPYIKAYETDRNGGHHNDPGDIVPSFYYDFGEGLQYYEGKLWPDQKDVYDNGCIR